MGDNAKSRNEADKGRMMRIRLELARDPEFPDGSRTHGYDMIIPLDGDGRVSLAGWKADRDHCRVKRFWGHDGDMVGHIVHKPGGSGGTWAFHYDIRGAEAGVHDEAGFHFESHAFQPGEYVSIKEQDGKMRTFRVQMVGPAD